MTTTKPRLAALGVLWKVLSKGRTGEPGLRARVSSLPRLARASLLGRYGGLSRSRLALMVVAVIYLFSPVDLVPEAFLGPLGLADDVALAAWLAGALLVETDRYLEWERSLHRVVRGTVVEPPDPGR